MTRPALAHADGSPLLDTETLTDYWLALLPSAHEEEIELHLMGCDACGSRLAGAIALAGALRELTQSGALQVIVPEAIVNRAKALGHRVRRYAPAAGGSVQCTVSADDDLLVAQLAADVSSASRVDLSWCDLQGVERQRLVDIPVGADAGLVLCQQSVTWAKASPTVSMMARLLSVDEHGREQVLGEFTFHHTRTIPGPPGWTLS